MASSALAAPHQDAAAEGIVRIEVLTSCPLCDSARLSHYATSYDRQCLLDKQRFVYSRCRDCDLVFESRRPVQADVGKLYPDNYGPYKPKRRPEKQWATTFVGRLAIRMASKAAGGMSLVARKLLPTRFETKYSKIYEPTREGASLFDFGCGSDKFMNRARKLGWKTTGADFSEIAVERARRSGHRVYVLSEQMWDELEDNSFDLVRLSHVLEHLYNPVEVLSRLLTKMRPGGKIHIAVPNPNGISLRFMRSYAFALDCPRHIMLFGPNRLQKLLSDVGFAETSILHEVVTKDMARSVVYWMYDRGLVEHATVETVIENRFIDAMLYAPAWLAAACGMGERIHAVGTKPLSALKEARRAA